MAAPDISSTDVAIQQNAGTPDQLPQGAAGALNAALPTESVNQPPVPSPAFPAAGSEQGASSAQPDFKPSTFDEQVLFGPSEVGGPNAPTQLPPGRLPDSVIRWLPVMRAAANEPTAPDSLRAIYAATVNALDAELR